MNTIQPVIAIHRIIDTVWALAFILGENNTVQIVGHSDHFNCTYEDQKLLPTYRLEEAEGRIVQAIVITELKDEILEKTRYTVSNPQFVFSYPQTIPTEAVTEYTSPFRPTEGFVDLQQTSSIEPILITTNKEDLMKSGTKQLKDRCLIEASGAFLTESFSEDLLQSNDDEIMAFIEGNKWEPVENYEASQIWELIEDHAHALEKFAQSEIERVQTHLVQDEPLFGVIWHYEGQTPTISTFRAADKEIAEAMFEEQMIDHISNHILEFYIDSIELITPQG
ncbi:hypothetical protein G6Z92_06125 [Vibrio aestuarianus subsp. cardii]|uniref:hypothetical protein n=1 Tax=Vibrio aestuarianus TaxID=28171 RepID=UPI0015C5491A|nr:hypothetical protein [Vibrio aestuarianus]NGZ66562.1 hypothetical protein [Vibrio aestuarianus subsp. cardii]